MPARQEVSSFIRSTFRSVWSLELLCFLRKNHDRAWTYPQLVVATRSSDLVVRQSAESLLAAGLVMINDEGEVRYQPVNDDADRLAGAAEAMYAQRPDAVRRLIVAPPVSSASIFADAFKLRRDE